MSQNSEYLELTSKTHLGEAGPVKLSYGLPISGAYNHDCKHTCEQRLG